MRRRRNPVDATEMRPPQPLPFVRQHLSTNPPPNSLFTSLSLFLSPLGGEECCQVSLHLAPFPARLSLSLLLCTLRTERGQPARQTMRTAAGLSNLHNSPPPFSFNFAIFEPQYMAHRDLSRSSSTNSAAGGGDGRRDEEKLACSQASGEARTLSANSHALPEWGIRMHLSWPSCFLRTHTHIYIRYVQTPTLQSQPSSSPDHVMLLVVASLLGLIFFIACVYCNNFFYRHVTLIK